MSENTADFTALAADLRNASRNVPAAMQQLLRQGAEEIQAGSDMIVPVKTGNLKRSKRIVEHPGRVEIGPDVGQAPYGPYVEYGTGEKGEFKGSAYEIRPKKPGGRLAFMVDGKMVYTKRVIHKGTRARPYMRPPFIDWLDTFGPKAADIGVQLIKGEKTNL